MVFRLALASGTACRRSTIGKSCLVADFRKAERFNEASWRKDAG
jgi:hypothetical protein